LRVLVVEDEADLAETTAALLAMYGHEVWTAHGGPAAFEAAKAEPPDVVLLDLGLPGALDGYGVARRLRQQPSHRRPVIIAVRYFAEDHPGRCVAAEWEAKLGWTRFLWCRRAPAP
jgi:CheY-like chemotaxis protein